VKALLDVCVWGGARDVLLAAGHEVESAAGWPRDPGDPQILAHAHQNGQVLITLDKDFGARSRSCVANPTAVSFAWSRSVRSSKVRRPLRRWRGMKRSSRRGQS
jgi:predicted nuclease of predicted toxin-antitoxin system